MALLGLTLFGIRAAHSIFFIGHMRFSAVVGLPKGGSMGSKHNVILQDVIAIFTLVKTCSALEN